MATLSCFGETYSCARAQKGNDYVRLLDTDNNIIFFADGITDFSDYVLTDGSWETPLAVVAPTVGATATLENGVIVLTVPAAVKVETGLQINFTAPCNCLEVTGLSIGGAAFTLVDSLGNEVSGGGSFIRGAVVAVILNVTENKAFLQNAAQSSGWKLIQSYTTAGSYEFTVPEGYTELGVYVVGGGGSGAYSLVGQNYSGSSYQQHTQAGGGAAGYASYFVYKKPEVGKVYPVVVGEGGAGQTSTSGSASAARYGNGVAGGSSSFDGNVVYGGDGGEGAGDGSGHGGQSSTAPALVVDGGKAPRGGRPVGLYVYDSTSSASYNKLFVVGDKGDSLQNPFDPEQVYLAAGGSCNNSNCIEQGAEAGGGTSGGAIYLGSGNTVADYSADLINATGIGNGGGALVRFKATYSAELGALTSGAGADGGVLIYGR